MSAHEPTNAERAERAFRALTRYDFQTERECAVTDLLTDLMHLCDEQGIDYENQERIARSHYYTEKGCYSSEGRTG